METQIFTSAKEPPQVSAEVVRRGVEYLSCHGMTAEELGTLRRHGLEPLARAINSCKGDSPR